MVLGPLVVARGLAALGPLLMPFTFAQHTREMVFQPATNIPPSHAMLAACGEPMSDACQQASVAAFDRARSAEGLGPMTLPDDFASLGRTAQLFVLTNLERSARGLPAVQQASAALDASALAGAVTGEDPNGPAGTQWGSVVAMGEGSTFEAVFDWVYDDGPGSPNLDCPKAGGSGCWGHREVVLGNWGPTPSFGVAVSGSSMAEIFVAPPPA